MKKHNFNAGPSILPREVIEQTAPALVLSIHQNYYPSSRSRGAQVFYDNNNDRGKTLSAFLQTRLNGVYIKEGVKEQGMLQAHMLERSLSACSCPVQFFPKI